MLTVAQGQPRRSPRRPCAVHPGVWNGTTGTFVAEVVLEAIPPMTEKPKFDFFPLLGALLILVIVLFVLGFAFGLF